VAQLEHIEAIEKRLWGAADSHSEFPLERQDRLAGGQLHGRRCADAIG